MSISTLSTHSTEALARKAARRHGRDRVTIVVGGSLREPPVFVVIACPVQLPFHEECVCYVGPGYACPREVLVLADYT